MEDKPKIIDTGLEWDDDELTEQEKTVVNLDFKMRADNLSFAAQEPWRCFAEKSFAFSYDIIPA